MKELIIYLFLVTNTCLFSQSVQLPFTNATSSSNRGPNGNLRWHRTCALYSSTELSSLNNKLINGIGFTIPSGQTANNPATGQIKVYLKNSTDVNYSLSSDTWTNVINGMTKVFDGNVTIPANPNISNVTYSISFNAPFTYSNSLYLAIDYSNMNGSLAGANTYYQVNNSVTNSIKIATSTTTMEPEAFMNGFSSFRPAITWYYSNLSNPTSVLNYEEECQVSCFPNPFTDKISIINTCTNERYELVMFDVLGNKVIESNHSNDQIIIPNSLPGGIYYLSIKFGEIKVLRKVIKQ